MIEQIPPARLKAWLDRPGERPVVLDVREPWEHSLCALPGAVHIPMGQVPAHLGDLCQERDIVVVCHHGFRSQQVAFYLERRGYRGVYNLAGGIDAWARDLDPAMATY